MAIDTSIEKWTEKIPEDIKDEFGDFYRKENINVEYYWPLLFAYRFLRETKDAEKIMFNMIINYIKKKYMRMGGM